MPCSSRGRKRPLEMLLQIGLPGLGLGQGPRPLRLIHDLLDPFPLLAPTQRQL